MLYLAGIGLFVMVVWIWMKKDCDNNNCKIRMPFLVACMVALVLAVVPRFMNFMNVGEPITNIEQGTYDAVAFGLDKDGDGLYISMLLKPTHSNVRALYYQMPMDSVVFHTDPSRTPFTVDVIEYEGKRKIVLWVPPRL